MELSSHLVCFVFASVSLCSVASCSICTEPLYNSQALIIKQLINVLVIQMLMKKTLF